MSPEEREAAMEMAMMLADLGEQTRETVSAMPDRLSNSNPQQQAELLRSAAAHREGATKGSEALSKWNNPESFRDGTESCHEARENYYDGQGHRRPGRSGGGGYDQVREGLELRVGEERAQWLSENHAHRGNLASANYAMTSGAGRGRGGMRDSVPRSGPDYSRGRLPPAPIRWTNANRAPSPRASGTVRFGRDGLRVGQGVTAANRPPVGSAAQLAQTGVAGTRRRVAAEAPATSTTRTTATANAVNTAANTRRAPDVPLSAIMGGPTHAQRQEAARGAMPRPTNPTSKLAEFDPKDRGRSAAPRDQTPADDSRASSIVSSKPLGHMEDLNNKRFKLQAMGYVQASPTYGANFYREHPERQQYYDAVRKHMVAEATGHAANPVSQEAKDCYSGEKKQWMLEAAVQARTMVREHTEAEADKYYGDNSVYSDFYAVAKQELKKENRSKGKAPASPPQSANRDASVESAKSASGTAEVATSLRNFSMTPGPHNASGATQVKVEAAAKAVQQSNSAVDNMSTTTALAAPSSPAKRAASTTIARAPAGAPPGSAAVNANKKSKRVKMVYDDEDSKAESSPAPTPPAPTNGVSKSATSSASAPRVTNHPKSPSMKTENNYDAALEAAQATAPAAHRTVNDLIAGPYVDGEEDYITKARAKRAENKASLRQNLRVTDKLAMLANVGRIVKTEPSAETKPMADLRKQTSSVSAPLAYAADAARSAPKAREDGKRDSATGLGSQSKHEPAGLQGAARLSEDSAREDAGYDEEPEPAPKPVKRGREISGLFGATTPAPTAVAPVAAPPVAGPAAAGFFTPTVKTEAALVTTTNGVASTTGTSVNGTSTRSSTQKAGKFNLKLKSSDGDDCGETKTSFNAKVTLEGVLRATDSDFSPLALTILAQMLSKKLPKLAKDAIVQAAMLQGGEEDSDEEL